MFYKLLCLLLLVAATTTSCIKEEPLYRETDIQSFRIEGDAYISTPTISNHAITVMVKNDADLTNLTPIIGLPEGATVSPASGVAQDFSNGSVQYTVRAQDSSFIRIYSVSVIQPSSLSLKFDFEKWQLTKSGYYDLMSNSGTELVKLWDSGNSGIAIYSKEQFPTTPDSTDYYQGHCSARLQTLKGNVNIGAIKVPIFSGSLFYGTFKLNILDPRKSVRLGQPHQKEAGKPLVFTGYYKYTPGTPFIYLEGSGKDAVEMQSDTIVDEAAMYAVLYKVTKGNSANEYLDGITIADDARIVARADWKKENASRTDRAASSGYTRFFIPFVYTEELDFNQYDYKLAILFASSKAGDQYRGAVGSTLNVDEVQIVCETIK